MKKQCGCTKCGAKSRMLTYGLCLHCLSDADKLDRALGEIDWTQRVEEKATADLVRLVDNLGLWGYCE